MDCASLCLFRGWSSISPPSFYFGIRVQDISVPEAVSLTDFDESALRANQAAANSLYASSAEGSVAKATATIQQNVNSAIARALNITL